MLGWVVGAIAAGCVCKAVSNNSLLRSENNYYRSICDDYAYVNNYLAMQNSLLRLNYNNHRRLLADFDKVNRYSKCIGYRGAVDFFYYLANRHDSRFAHFARFLNKVRYIRNDIAHNGATYSISQSFLDKLSNCVEICREYDRLPQGRTLYIN